MSRRKAREVALKTLFQIDLVPEDPEEAIKSVTREMNLRPKDLEFIRQLVVGTMQNREAIDRWISRFSQDWPLERMNTVDRNLLRMATYEITVARELKPVIPINEAIELAKIYGDDNSPSFINAILDRIREVSQ